MHQRVPLPHWGSHQRVAHGDALAGHALHGVAKGAKIRGAVGFASLRSNVKVSLRIKGLGSAG